MIVPCDFCDLVPSFCDGDEERCAVVFVNFEEKLRRHNNAVMKNTINFIIGEKENEV